MELVFWTKAMIEDATVGPCGALLDNEDIAERLQKTRVVWERYFDAELLKMFGNAKASPVPMGALHARANDG